MPLYLSRPELGLDGTNNSTERGISKSKVRYKTMRGYKSIDGMNNGIALTQWLYSGKDEHDLSKEMGQRRDHVGHLAETDLPNSPTARGTVTGVLGSCDRSCNSLYLTS
jgi:hypothetical protein